MAISTARAKAELGWAIATLVGIAATLAVNTLSNIFPPGGENVGEIANTTLAGVLITPANYAFAIWGLIYLGLIAYGVYQLRCQRRHSRSSDLNGDSSTLVQESRTLGAVSRLLLLACGAQILWIFLFTLQFFTLSIGAMLGILLALMVAYLRLEIGQVPSRRARRWFVNYPFSVYLAWISVATVINIASALYAAGWQGWGLGPEIWTVIMVAVTGAIAAVVIWQRRDVAFTLVYLWAYGAIAVRHTDQPLIWGSTAISAALLLALLGWRCAANPTTR